MRRRFRHPLAKLHLARRLWTDRLARVALALAATAVLVAGLMLAGFLVGQVSSLFTPARVDPVDAARDHPAAALLFGLALTRDNDMVALGENARFYRIALDGAIVQGAPLFPGDMLEEGRLVVDDERRIVALLHPSGKVLLRRIQPGERPGRLFEGQLPSELEIDAPVTLALAPDGDSLFLAGCRREGALVFAHRSLEENGRLGAPRGERVLVPIPSSHGIRVLEIDPLSGRVFGGTDTGALFAWKLGYAAPRWSATAAASAGVSALALSPGGRALLVGKEDGTLSVWFASGADQGERVLRESRVFPPRPAEITAIVPRAHDKSFAALDAGGGLVFGNTTSGVIAWAGEHGLDNVRDVILGPESLALVGQSASRWVTYDLRHPELTLETLVFPVWYEAYPEAAHLWQSTGGWEGYEPKLGLVPLVVGTLKGALYALAFALPLGLLAALYTSQFMHPTLKGVIKPGLEMLASFPTVVLGFVGGVWLAPRLAPMLPALLIAVILVPLAALLGGWLWSRRPSRVRGWIDVAGELALITSATALALYLSSLLGGLAADLFFDGSAATAIGAAGLVYEQRNALLVGIVMGFAVVPLVFTVAEEAFSAVPRSLISGSLALGATPWRTVREIVLPTASPGIVAAILLGLGRALGETMIVLMIAGNTPLLSASPFTGFRAMTATIASEIQDAAPESPLFTVLLLASLALLVTTFLVNVAAGLVRGLLRRRLEAFEEV